MRKGITYEALVRIALDQLVKTKVLRGKVFWNETPAGMLIEPDFTVGHDKDQPTLLMLVTHSGAAGNSHMKYWRNMGELVEAKTALRSVPSVYSVAFDPVIKADLKRLQTAAFDGQLIVGEKKYGQKLQAWVDANWGDLPIERSAKVEAIRGCLGQRNGGALRLLLQKLTTDITALVGESRPELEHLWQLERRRPRGVAPRARKTCVRRGLSKLLVFQNPELAVNLYSGKRIPCADIPDYAFDLGLAGKSIGAATPTDDDIKNVVRLLGAGTAKRLVSAPIAPAVSAWLATLRGLSVLSTIGEYVLREFDVLVRPSELKTRLLSLYERKEALIPAAAFAPNPPPATVWLLEYLVELVKASTGQANGYGYAQLGRDVVAEGFTRRRVGNPRIWVGGFILSQWIKRGAQETMDDEAITGIAVVLSRRLKSIGRAGVAALTHKLPLLSARNIIESKLVTYRGFDPLAMLITEACPGCQRVRIDTAFAEAAGIGGQAGKTQVMRLGQTLVNWQSAHGSHTNDKRKELGGRAVALRYSWHAPSRRFVARPGVEKLILVVDGSWKQSDLDALVRAGWDEVFYPDEMGKLAKAIV